MNGRITVILKKSGLQAYYDYQEKDIERFAELLIKECVTVVADLVDHREPASTYTDKIKEHFGTT